ncbi:Alb1-domain-containing protein [Hypoxylon sp. NC1633]|nr:Alb1-domain-containing protein [Hypoxylon sp. NC1633]
MAKGSITKKKKATSVRSRAARRATSPGIDTDKSLKMVQPPADSVHLRPSVLAIHQGAGVSKKARKGRNMSSRARKRFEKGQDHASAVMERTEQKIAKSKGQAQIAQTRRKAWDEINKQMPAEQKISKGETNGREDQELSELDDQMDDAQAEKAPKGPEGATSTNKTPTNEAMEVQDDVIL